MITPKPRTTPLTFLVVMGTECLVSAARAMPYAITHVPNSNTVAVLFGGVTGPAECAALGFDFLKQTRF